MGFLSISTTLVVLLCVSLLVCFDLRPPLQRELRAKLPPHHDQEGPLVCSC